MSVCPGKDENGKADRNFSFTIQLHMSLYFNFSLMIFSSISAHLYRLQQYRNGKQKYHIEMCLAFVLLVMYESYISHNLSRQNETINIINSSGVFMFSLRFELSFIEMPENFSRR